MVNLHHKCKLMHDYIDIFAHNKDRKNGSPYLFFSMAHNNDVFIMLNNYVRINHKYLVCISRYKITQSVLI